MYLIILMSDLSSQNAPWIGAIGIHYYNEMTGNNKSFDES